MEEQGLRYVIDEAAAILHTYFYEKEIIWFVLTAILCVNLLRVVIGTLFKSRKKEWDSYYFKWLCFAIAVWTMGTLYPYLLPHLPAQWAANTGLLAVFQSTAKIGSIFFLPLLCLHIWRQVSYREITGGTIALYFLPAVCLSSMIVYDLIQANVNGAQVPWMSSDFGRVAYYLYAVAVLIKTYLMMFNVFYQMPPHMRRSTRHMLSGVTFVVAAEFIRLLFPNLPPYDFTLLGAHIMLDYLYNAFSIDSSANVIVTSRDFVFGNLSTMVIILSKRMNILDWNRKTDANKLLLPNPQYKEPFRHYYQRILNEGNGRVSAHDRNIITTTRGEDNGHYLITTHEVKRKKKHFGYLVEISEVTKIYTVFRYLEEIAIKDQLTGLYNRNAYMGMVGQMVASENLPLLVVVGDMNNLKPINDIFGHLRGDELLKVASESILKHSPKDSFVARIGGDEFVMLVPNSSVEVAQAFIETVGKSFASLFVEADFEASISWGYAMMMDSSQSYNEIFDKADAMMYTYKKKRSRFHSSGIVPDSVQNGGEEEEQPPVDSNDNTAAPPHCNAGGDGSMTSSQREKTMESVVEQIQPKSTEQGVEREPQETTAPPAEDVPATETGEEDEIKKISPEEEKELIDLIGKILSE